MLNWRALALLAITGAAHAKRPQLQHPMFAEVDVGLYEVDGTVAAFGDINGDKLMDIIVLKGNSIVNTYIWDRNEFKFEKGGLDIDLGATFKSSQDSSFLKDMFTHRDKLLVTNVVPADFNNDGKLDLLTYSKISSAKFLDLNVFFGDGSTGYNTANMLTLSKSSEGQPFLIDYHGTMSANLLGNLAEEDDQLSVWHILPNSTFLMESVQFATAEASSCKLDDPHSSAFVDLDGDCLADSALQCVDPKTKSKSIQVRLNSKSVGFRKGPEILLPDNVGPVGFADFDGSGTIDMIYASCTSSKNCLINIAYNTQIPLCKTFKSAGCRPSDYLCTADSNFVIDTSVTGIPVSEILGDRETLKIVDDKPLPFRIGDFNNDGFPDLLILTERAGKSYVRLLESIPCTKRLCSATDVFRSRRAFSLVTTGVGELSTNRQNALTAAFFDIDDDGTLDIVAVYERKDKSKEIVFFMNNFYLDAFFLKALVSNGACPTCSDRYPGKKAYGATHFGASFKYTVTDNAGRVRAAHIAQLPQVGYFALQTPYSFFGLGRTNNYIESLFVGITRNQTDNVATYQGIIPNSQLIVIPYQPQDIKDSSFWRLELLINPARYARYVFVVLLVVQVILSMIVTALHMVERREDEHEKRSRRHAINFDAL